MKNTFTILTLLIFSQLFSQEKSELKATFSGFVETYYSYDFNQPLSDA